MKRQYKMLLIYSMMILILGIIFILATLTIRASRESEDIFDGIEIPHYDYCTRYDLEITAFCIRKYIKQNYNFTPTLSNPKRKIKDILENGGDCYDWSRAYKKIAEELGFQADMIYIYRETTEPTHVFTLMYNDEGYCILEQEKLPKCNLK